MRGNEEIHELLNHLLADELTAINQYMLHAAMCANWGYEKLHLKIEERAVQEMKHAELLIDRIIFLEGTPNVSKLNRLNIGASVEKLLQNDHVAEQSAIQAYNDAGKLAYELSDSGSRELIISILKDEEKHIDWIETQLDQIVQMGIQVYLSEQAG